MEDLNQSKVVIFSEDEDITTDYVLDWFLNKNIYFTKSTNSKLNIIDSFTIDNETVNINIDDINNKKLWFRRGKINFKVAINYTHLDSYLIRDEFILIKSIESVLIKKTDYIGSYIKEVGNNKVEILIKARNCGLRIPRTLITSKKNKLQFFFDKLINIITKDLNALVNFTVNNTQYSSVGTIQVTQEMIDKCNDYFMPMFLQERVEKKYEVRVFMFKDKLFPMAIFSQNDKKTALDYRNYNNEKPNRNVPIILPKEIETKIFKLTKSLELNTCSIDFIVNTNNEYVFLEVNPMGQLDWVSKNCNYYIEKYIAEELMA